MNTTPKKKGHPSTKKLADLTMTDAQRSEYLSLKREVHDVHASKVESDSLLEKLTQLNDYNDRELRQAWTDNAFLKKDRDHYAKKADQASAFALLFAGISIGLFLLLVLTM